ncbi:MAG: NADPH-dependent 7-cyano-7-deazaguanine reductase QueF [Cupriavidus sp.]|jgi:7-cyano-7-deazaguanine reductase|uniref:NADPH-dependent 7-cyano-7-deazaguanine reductase QueF n=1 Tax=Cupriavidus pauculus TaxID=82633 RepID=UPI000786606A|nr:NADPH-dependent 7-cyano-7-deazaguanine reductase QueF [Cupriavidus pauculus]MBU64248.1 NADPH-dependent 7-cyano-7-deazaguanine reductase QueF [Cupriavidus sp.]KAB0603260.1 NADPH-dependent 7-cyano-7-deazaguanine reductase QueF [Cupriavidus pauculus]MBY4732411.1 NADPH-dependent 7-cyano-7-deazaguanine reductase QueF [Cupriavidus pauculus]MCM3604489.1 NADPH-dependent 7-cyano-7-deazaguanine reductase QueF [Cupriavidus pauculus]UAK98541.1 NADPH-dependent 7-cyano-7-deazaguanine reductase QueF [Cupr
MTLPEHSPLGKASAYKTEYDPTLLFPIPRQAKRTEIGLDEGKALPFFGVDIWNAYEVSWLNLKGKPQVALATFIIPADTPNIVESKSFKLYLNSFNQTKLASAEALQQMLQRDVSAATGGTVQVRLVTEADLGTQKMGELDGLLLDRLDIETDIYEPDPTLLKADQEESPVEESLVSHLLKSNCLVTGQPDWGSVQIRYVGAPIDQEGLLKYLISFRNHNEFHEQCVERIFTDVMRMCKPVKLAVYARYTRRGGLDINPFRTNFNTPWPDNRRNARQ